MRCLSYIRGLLAGSACLLASQSAMAHVAFDDGNEVLVLTPGETVTLAWHVVISHDTLAHHLEFVPTPDAAPETIVRDLPPEGAA